MKVKLYAVYDKASGVYDGPVPCNADGVALRNFTNMAKNPDTPVGRNPECFSIWRVGQWDDAAWIVTGKHTQDSNQQAYPGS